MKRILSRKTGRTLKQYRVQFLSMIVMIAMGVGVFTGFHMEWVSLENNLNRFFDETAQPDYYIYDDRGFSDGDLQKLRQTDFISAADRSAVLEAQVDKQEDDLLAVVVPEKPGEAELIYTEKDCVFDSEKEDGIWLSDRYAAENDLHCGDELTLSVGSIELKGKICGLVKSAEYLVCVRDKSQLMPDYSTYGFAYVSPALFRRAMGFDLPYTRISVHSELGKSEFKRRTEETLGRKLPLSAKEDTLSYNAAQSEIREGKIMSTILPPLFLGIAVLSMISSMRRLAIKEKTQIGTLKALGFRHRRIVRSYTAYPLYVAAVGIPCGVVIGFIIARIIIDPNGTMATYLDMPYWELEFPWFCYVSLALLAVFLVVVGRLSVRQLLKGTAAESLRPYVPKIKKASPAKLLLFQNAKFGTRWNLRDIARHKSRTLMTLVGIVGCMTMLVSALGLRDTMDHFFSVYCDQSLAYTARICCRDDAPVQEVEALCEKYQGDSSAAVAIEIGQKAYSLDIYDIRSEAGSEKLRFISSTGGFTQLGEDGAYICMRIADRFSLSAGDTVRVCEYGSEKQYDLHISGVIRSVDETVVISRAYAQKLGIEYRPDSVYTATDQQIEKTDHIRTVQTKQTVTNAFNNYLKLINLMIFVLLFASVVLGVVVLYNLGMMSYAERYREMATLKVLGFRDRRIGALLVQQNMWLTICGILLGAPCGAYTLNALVIQLGEDYEMQTAIYPLSYLICAVVTIGVSLAVARWIGNKNKTVSMAEAMKGAE